MRQALSSCWKKWLSMRLMTPTLYTSTYRDFCLRKQSHLNQRLVSDGGSTLGWYGIGECRCAHVWDTIKCKGTDAECYVPVGYSCEVFLGLTIMYEMKGRHLWLSPFSDGTCLVLILVSRPWPLGNPHSKKWHIMSPAIICTNGYIWRWVAHMVGAR